LVIQQQAIIGRSLLLAVICLPRILLIKAVICAAWVMPVGVGYGHGAYHDVVASLEKRIKEGTKEPELRFELACAHQEHGEWAQALAELERVERLAPGLHETGLIQGMALATGRHWAAALAVLDDFLAVRPGQVLALRARGRVLRERGRAEAALNDLKEALEREVRPTGEAVVEVAELLTGCGRETEALEVLRTGWVKTGDKPVLLEALQLSATRLRCWEVALEAVAALEGAAPRPEPWRVMRAELLETAGRRDEALGVWQALRDHLMKLPSLERGTGELADCLNRARRALGETVLKPVVALPVAATTRQLEASNTVGTKP
jgi:tetratricopeptide (TPR) repeat protein